MKDTFDVRFINMLKTIGPGILFAGAAIGVSHLVQSSRAGASYGFQLIWAVVLANVLKYPFFEFSQRYTTATGKSILEGYLNLGRWVVYLFLALTLLTSIINVAAITVVTAGLAGSFLGISLSPFLWSLIIFFICMVILIANEYRALDKTMKFVVAVLSISTAFALFMAVKHGSSVQPGFIKPDLWNLAGVSFLLALMGWMPAPIEVSVWTSLWALERRKQTGYKPTMKESMVDFYLGYAGASVMALMFLALGALVMYGTGEKFSASGTVFAGQLVSLYTKTLGGWSMIVISAAAFTTMFSTTLTVIDAYPRSIRGAVSALFPERIKHDLKNYWGWVLFVTLSSLLVIGVFAGTMRAMVDLATVIAFLSAPVFAFMNYKVVTSDNMPVRWLPPGWLIALSWVGIIFLSGFSVLFIMWRFFIS